MQQPIYPIQKELTTHDQTKDFFFFLIYKMNFQQDVLKYFLNNLQ